MAANPNKISTFQIPTEFEPYKQEGEYISPNKVISKNAQKKIDRIKARKIGIGVADIFNEAKVA